MPKKCLVVSLFSASESCSFLSEQRGDRSTMMESLPEHSGEQSKLVESLPEHSGSHSTTVESLPRCSAMIPQLWNACASTLAENIG
jgi:hypothetical protein